MLTSKANIHVLQSEKLPTATSHPPLPPATLLGWSGETQIGFMASWPLQRDAWIQTRHTPLLACALTLLLSLREKGREGEQATQQMGTAAAILLQSVCTHTLVQVGETGRDWKGVIKLNVFACVCAYNGERRRHEISPSANSQESTWVRPHPASSPTKNPKPENTLAAFYHCTNALWGFTGRRKKTQHCKLPEACRLERL